MQRGQLGQSRDGLLDLLINHNAARVLRAAVDNPMADGLDGSTATVNGFRQHANRQAGSGALLLHVHLGSRFTKTDSVKSQGCTALIPVCPIDVARGHDLASLVVEQPELQTGRSRIEN